MAFSFMTNPRAPCRIACRCTSGSRTPVKTRIRVSGATRWSVGMLVIAFSPPKSRSRTMTSGCVPVARAPASAHVAASPTTTRPGWLSSSMRKPARIIPWSSTIRTRTDEGGSIAIHSLQLERDVHYNDGLAGRRPGHLGGAPEGRGPLGNRPRGEGLGLSPRDHVVGNTQVEILRTPAQRHPGLPAAGVPPHVTEPFRHHLEHLRRQPIMDRERGWRLHLHGNPGGLRKFGDKTVHRREEPPGQQPTLPRPGLPEFP